VPAGSGEAAFASGQGVETLRAWKYYPACSGCWIFDMRNRRTLLTAIAGALITVFAPTRRGLGAATAVRTQLLPTEPAAVAIAYIESAARVDARLYPAYRRGQSCVTCGFVEFGTGRTRGCSVVPGRLVLATGWCKVWKLRGND
jgi:hypothetical protein